MDHESSPVLRCIPHAVIVRAPGLLPMMYRVSELAQDLHISSSTIYEWIRRGMPCQRDKARRVWVNGREFAGWIEQQRELKRGPGLAVDEAYCVRCRQAVKLVSPTRRISGKRVLLQSNCPRCGAKINKGVANGEQREL